LKRISHRERERERERERGEREREGIEYKDNENNSCLNLFKLVGQSFQIKNREQID
jgi:hypothetical protein